MGGERAAKGDGVRAWGAVLNELRNRLGAAPVDFYLKDLRVAGEEEGTVTLGAPTAFIRRYVAETYSNELLRAWVQVRPGTKSVEIVVTEDGRAQGASANGAAPQHPVNGAIPHAGNGAVPAPAFLRASAAEAGALGQPLDPSLTFDTFVVGKPNEFAYNAARRFAEAEKLEFNPLFLHGTSGVGKTHLAQAIAWDIQSRRPNDRVLYLSAERFINEFIRAIRFKDTMAFKEKLRGADVLIIDDLHFIAGKESTQEEFFHTFNALVDSGKRLIFTADRPPIDLDGVGERVKSRLAWGLVADIHPADYELRLGILQSKAERFAKQYPGVAIPPKVIQFLAQRVIVNIRALEGALRRVVLHANMMREPVTEELAQRLLPDLLRASDRKVLIEDIQKKTAEYYNIRLADLLSPRRARVVARPRQVAMWLAKKLTTRSLPEIGRKFGGRDHTTVIHAVKRIDELRQIDSALNEDLQVLRRLIEG